MPGRFGSIFCACAREKEVCICICKNESGPFRWFAALSSKRLSIPVKVLVGRHGQTSLAGMRVVDVSCCSIVARSFPIVQPVVSTSRPHHRTRRRTIDDQASPLDNEVEDKVADRHQIRRLGSGSSEQVLRRPASRERESPLVVMERHAPRHG